MRFLLHLADADGRLGEAIYDTADSSLIIDGTPWPVTEVPRSAPAAPPGRKRGPFRRLKIQMGLACNMRCAYCLQAAHADTGTGPDDARAFVAGLDRWWSAVDESRLGIEFWGGEPLLQWDTLTTLVQALRMRHPKARMSVCTNGTLLTTKRAKWLQDRGVGLAVSHDGPGQTMQRGVDPLENPEALAAIRWLVQTHPEHIGFNAVLTLPHHRLGAIRDHLEQVLGTTGLILSTEGLMQVEGTPPSRLSPVTDEDHRIVRLSLLEEMVSGEALRNGTVSYKARDFLHSLNSGRPLALVGQKCGMDREDVIAVDLTGNVLTCQNTPDEAMRIGHVNALADVRLDETLHFSHRETCMTCPVVQLCQGGCMALSGDAWKASCRNSFTFHSAILSGALHLVTGKLVTRIEPAA